MPLVQIGGRIEIDIATLGGPAGKRIGDARDRRLGTAPPDAGDPDYEAAGVDSYEVKVFREFGGPQLRAAIELVSPANKDRPASRHAFAGKCAGYLRRGVSLIVIDPVTSRTADMHAEILRALEPSGGTDPGSPGALFAASYRVPEADPLRLEAWPQSLAIGSPLPTLPLWLEPDLTLHLALEESYAITCESLRLRG